MWGAGLCGRLFTTARSSISISRTLTSGKCSSLCGTSTVMQSSYWNCGSTSGHGSAQRFGSVLPSNAWIRFADISRPFLLRGSSCAVRFVCKHFSSGAKRASPVPTTTQKTPHTWHQKGKINLFLATPFLQRQRGCVHLDTAHSSRGGKQNLTITVRLKFPLLFFTAEM